jgi:thiamine pyrophosphokinase
MQGILITGGQRPDFSRIKYLLEKPSYVIAADSGLDYCLDHSIKPDYILGDMDAISSKELLRGFNPEIVEKHSEDKDFTDTELGLMHLQSKGHSPVIIIGGGGGRLDHLLGISNLFERQNPPDLWITQEEEVHYIHKAYSGRGQDNELISFFPLGSQTVRMTSSGLKWPLDNLHWKRGDAGISNRLTGKEFSIAMTSGHLMMIREIQKPG